jgi:heat shock protein HslJ
MTEMGCEQPLMEQDDWFVGFMTSSPSFSFDGSRLTFVNSEVTLVFLDSEIATPDQDLVGIVWNIDTFIDGESASAFNLSASPTLEFSADGSVQFFSGCNSGSGSYELGADGAISFVDMVATEMACDEMEMSAESHMYRVFSDTSLHYEIDANRLSIVGDSVGISGLAAE